jgi:hypothetical protein
MTRAEPLGPARVRRGPVPYLIVYVAPLCCWAMMGCVATLLYEGPMRPGGPSVVTLMTALIAPAIEGFRDIGVYVWVVLHLAVIGAFAVKPHPLTGGLSFLALGAWVMWGVWIVSTGW